MLNKTLFRPSFLTAVVVLLLAGFSSTQSYGFFQDNEKDKAAEGPASELEQRQGILIQIRLPVTGETSSQIKQVIARHLETIPVTEKANQRPVMVLEFDTANARNGRGSEFEACLSLARYLTSSQMNQVETVAYVPEPKGILADAEIDGQLKSELFGHPVLIAMACNQIVMHPESRLGQAGIDEEFVDSLIVAAYKDIAGKRLTLPTEVANALVDPASSLFRIQTADNKNLFVNREELKKLETDGKVVTSDTLTESGSLPIFDSGQLFNYQLIRFRASSRRDIARRFNLKPNSLEGDPTFGKKWTGIQVSLEQAIDQKTVSWVINALENHWTEDSNLIIIRLDTEQVDVREAIRLARHLASYDSNQVRTIAYVPNQARAAAGIIALACDHLVMSPNAVIGGGTVDLTKLQVDELIGSIQDVAETKNRDWSLFVSMLNPTTPVFRYRQKETGQIRLLSRVEHETLDDKDEWLPLGELNLENGIDGETAEQYFIARYLVDDFDQLKTFYQLKDDPKLLQPTLTDRWIESFAGFLASPIVAFWLLFGAMFFISSEMSQPGVGVPGFIGAMLLVLFFWSQFLDGNADWLEIILFVAGVICILLEIFVIPGLGIFGFGGLVMVVISIVLASQSFIIPRNSEEFRQLPASLMMVIGAGGGSIAAMVVFRKFLPHMPVLKRLMLTPPSKDTADGLLNDPEAVVNLAHLHGKHGQALTELMPTGKAQFGDEIVNVITDGRLIEKNATVIVQNVSGNIVRVAPVDEA